MYESIFKDFRNSPPGVSGGLQGRVTRIFKQVLGSEVYKKIHIDHIFKKLA